MNFKSFLLSEAAFGPQNISYSPTGFPNIRVSVLQNGREIQLWLLRGQGAVESPHNVNYAYRGDLGSECFGETDILRGYKLYNWHADGLEGYGPFFYDIATEIATKNHGCLASTTFLNALKNLDPTKRKESKGIGSGGDSSDAVENIYHFYYHERKNEVEKVTPNIILANEDDQAKKPYMYELYKKQPTTLNQLIKMNNNGKQPVLVKGSGAPISDLNQI